ncbi:MAG TPA: TonB-dependent receptor [Vicinamibacteria bacterium]|nr:TonB-dependent receptor [Vicinamibacteria bacterium]
MKPFIRIGPSFSVALTFFVSLAKAQETGSVSGTVTLAATGDPVHGAIVLVIGLGEFTTTDSEGHFRFDHIPAGTHYLLVQREHLTAERQQIIVTPEQNLEVEFALGLSPIHENVTVTTSARGEATALEQFNAVTTLDSFELSKDMWGSLGEVLQNEAGVAKRSFGPASSRPIIRGFDGDRVLIMEDGIRTGDLSSQSADHGVTIDPANLERIEIIKGPATLLYGSNAVGGVVNTITPHDSFRRSQPQGMRGQVVLDAGSANDQLGGNANLRYGNGGWMFWGSGGARRTGDYDTPGGRIENSASELANGSAGAGFYGDRAFISLGYGIEDGRFGIPGAGELHGHEGEEGEHAGEEAFFVDSSPRRQNVRFDVGLSELDSAFLDSTRVTFQYTDWNHDEIEIADGIEAVATSFMNDVYLLRAELEQRRSARLSGRFGLWFQNRDYEVIGEEALAPRTKQNAFAGFAYEELTLGSATTLSFGGRVEYNDYDPAAREGGQDTNSHEGEVPVAGHEDEPPESIARSFTGLSGSVGLRHDLTSSAALVGNFTSSYRAPALEELYNFGPHVGNLAFEIGDPNLGRERINGIDLALRGRSSGLDTDVNFFYYDIGNFVYPAFQEEIVNGLRLAEYRQDDARFVGFDAQANLRVTHFLWIKAGFGYVDAKLTDIAEYVPRIPPFHGRVEIEIPYEAFTITPEIIWSARQDRIFGTGETPTDGYIVLNLKAHYTLARTHQAHIFSVNAYNLTDELYRMHTNFIKDFAPEIGRGVKFTYSLRLF